MALRCLLLGRDPEILRVFRRAAQELELTLEFCTRAEAAIERLRREKFDSVIVDCDGVANSDDVLRYIQNGSSNRRAIALAIINGISTLHEAFEWGGHFVLEKPVSLENANRSLRAAHGFMIAERRRYARFPVQNNVFLSFGGKKLFRSTSSNIGEGGIAVKVPPSVAPGDEVTVQFELPGVSQDLEAQGEISWTDRKGKAGIRFTQIAGSSRKVLNKWLADRAAELGDDAADLPKPRTQRAVSQPVTVQTTVQTPAQPIPASSAKTPAKDSPPSPKR